MKSMVALAGLLLPAVLYAGVSAEQAARLTTDLTPLGAERAGNDDGIIPPWTGGLTEPPAAYQPGDHHPDPFIGETESFRIDAGNLDEHRDRLSAAQVAFLQRYPEHYFAVYPTHRTAAYPERVYEMTATNAVNGSLSESGDGVSGVSEGYPFPIPARAEELIWNHRLRYKGSSSKRHIQMAAPTVSGAFNTVSMTVVASNPYYRQGVTLEEIDNRLQMFTRSVTAPPAMAGNVLLVHESLNQSVKPRKVWVYSPGQRRVRKLSKVAYDSPSNGTDGMHFSDMTDMFNGALDRYDWELKGKREMYVPYNAYRLHSGDLDYDDLLRPGHLDPAPLRYELHRVWVVEAKLRPGARHKIPHRVFYLDEDSYQILVVDHNDEDGQPWRYSEAHAINFYELPAVWTAAEVHHDLKAGRYAVFRLDPTKPVEPFNQPAEDRDFQPDALRRGGRR